MPKLQSVATDYRRYPLVAATITRSTITRSTITRSTSTITRSTITRSISVVGIGTLREP